jgi:hypothetical protein
MGLPPSKGRKMAQIRHIAAAMDDKKPMPMMEIVPMVPMMHEKW